MKKVYFQKNTTCVEPFDSRETMCYNLSHVTEWRWMLVTKVILNENKKAVILYGRILICFEWKKT